MPDGFGVHMSGFREVERDFRDIDRHTTKATMWIVREAGRVARKEARRAAPVLKPKDGQKRITVKQVKAGGIGKDGPPVPGLLRASIASSKRLKRPAPGTYRVGVAPRGLRVHLYSQKVEAQAGYMKAGYDAADSAMPGIAERAWSKTARRR